MPEPLAFVQCADGYELRRADETLGRVGAVTEAEPLAEAGGASWRLAIEGDREELGATWTVVGREPGDDAEEPAGSYFHGSMRGGRVRAPGDEWGTLRRGLGVGVEWRLRLPESAVSIRPSVDGEGQRLDLAFVAGSADIPELLLLLICWSIMTEETIGPIRRAG